MSKYWYPLTPPQTYDAAGSTPPSLGHWVCDSQADLPASGNPGDTALTKDTTTWWVRTATGWLASPTILRTTADQVISVVTATAVTGLSFPMAASTDYAFEGLLVFSSAATTTGIAFGLTGPASPVSVSCLIETQTTLTALGIATLAAYGLTTPTASVDVAGANRFIRFKGIVRNGTTAGNLQVQAASEVAASAVTIKRGSYVQVF